MTRTDTIPGPGVDPRAVHRALTGIRDRLRLQEDELDRIREGIRPARTSPAAATPRLDAIEAGVEQIRAEMAGLASGILPRIQAIETQLGEQARLVQEAFSTIAATDTSLRRLIDQIDRLLEQVSTRPAPMPRDIEITAERSPEPSAKPSTGTKPGRPARPRHSPMFTAVEDLDNFGEEEQPGFNWSMSLLTLAALLAFLATMWYFFFRE